MLDLMLCELSFSWIAANIYEISNFAGNNPLLVVI